jgi:hypothetical protein
MRWTLKQSGQFNNCPDYDEKIKPFLFATKTQTPAYATKKYKTYSATRLPHRTIQTMWETQLPLRQNQRAWPGLLSFRQHYRTTARDDLCPVGAKTKSRTSTRKLWVCTANNGRNQQYQSRATETKNILLRPTVKKWKPPP